MEEVFFMLIMLFVRFSVYKIKRRNVYIGLFKLVIVLKILGGKCMWVNFKEFIKRSVKKERML